MARSYAALPHEYLDEMASLTDEEWGRLTRALLCYSATGQEPALTGNERFFWRRVLNREQCFQQHYRDLAEQRSAAGKKGMARRWGGAAGENRTNNVRVLPSTDGKKRQAAQSERMRRDVEEIEKLTAGTARPEGKGAV